jgi:hypothetical protein
MTERIILFLQNNYYPILALQGEEALSTLYYFKVILPKNAELYANECLYQSAQLKITDAYHGTRTIPGIIVECKKSSFSLELLLTSRLSLLKNIVDSRTFVNQSLQDIVETILQKIDYHATQLHWNLKNQLQPISFRIQLPKESDFNFLQSLLSDFNVDYFFTESNGIEQLYFTDHQSDFLKRETPLCITPINNGIYQEHCLWNPTLSLLNNADQKLFSQAASADLFPGQIVLIHTDSFHPLSDKRYQIHHISHHAIHPEPNCNVGKLQAYQQKIVFISTHNPKVIKKKSHPFSTCNLTADIHSTELKIPNLNDCGYYQSYYHFELKKTTAYFMPRLLPYAGLPNTCEYEQNTTGYHAPFNDMTEVLVSHKNNIPHDPFIVGSMPNDKKNSPINHANPTQHRFNSIEGHELCMEDLTINQHLSLHTQDKKNQLYMSHTDKKIQLITQEGKLHFYAKQKATLRTDENFHEIVSKNLYHHIQRNHTTKVTNDISYQSGKDYKIHSQQTIHLTADNQNVFHSKGNLHVSSAELAIKTSDSNIQLQSHQGTIQINTNGNTTKITSHSDVHISTGGAGILLSPSGAITVYGQSVGGFSPSVVPQKHAAVMGFPVFPP